MAEQDRSSWLHTLRRSLFLGRKGVIIQIRQARPDRLAEVCEVLCAVDPDLVVVEHARDLPSCVPGSLILLRLRAEDLDWLNINRPIFAQRGWRVVIWAEGDLSVQLKFFAPDLWDWVSHRIDCPA